MESIVANRRMATRSSKLIEENDKPYKDGSKRAAEFLPDIGNKKRILGDITNQPKVTTIKTSTVPNRKLTKSKSGSENSLSSVNSENFVIKDVHAENDSPKKADSSQNETMYTTALEDSMEQMHPEKRPELGQEEQLPEGVIDFDKSCQKDPYSESRYAKDIFKYYLQREEKFKVRKYLDWQKDMTKGMRAILVDWMVEVQESFELNHETLYLAVKLVDLFLMKHFVSKAQLQLVGATAICIASKFDERQPPLVDDFLYICDDTYNRDQLILTEMQILKTVDFDLGMPLSYRFLRRYARCAKIPMDLLTLARFILETSLMDYELMEVLDSKLAAAALLLALKMKKLTWNVVLQYYSGYKEDDLNDLIPALNKNISGPINNHLQTIRTKYSHPVFYEVSKIPPLNLSTT